MKRKSIKPVRDRKGVILVLAALMMATLIGLVAFAVDYGHLLKVRTDLQRSADACALAAVQDLVPRDDGTQDLNNARETVRVYARRNLANDSIQVASGDIQFGRYDRGTVYSNFTLLNTGTFDTARVTLRRDGATNPSVPLFFARIFGMQNTPITAQATAVLQTAQMLEPGSELLPFATPKPLWDSLASGDIWTAYGDGKLKDTFGNDVPGNWGTLDIGQTNNSTSELVDQILNGLRQKDIDALHAEGRISQTGHIDSSQPTWMQGDPGLSSGVKSAVQAVHGKKKLIPIYDTLGSPSMGNNVDFHVVAWGVVTVVDSKWQGEMNTYVKVKKSHAYSGLLKPNGNLAATGVHIEGAYTTPVLVE